MIEKFVLRRSVFLFQAVCIVLAGYTTCAQSLEDLENVSLHDSIFVFEQRVHRDYEKYFGYITDEYAHIAGLAPMHHGVPMGTFTKSQKTWKVSETEIPKSSIKTFKDYKLDFWIRPDYRAIYGNKLQAVESKTGINLSTSIILLPGLAVYSGLHIPLINDIDQQPLNLRWAPSYIDFFRKVGSNSFVDLSAGLFFQDRYGFNLEYHIFPLDKSWSFGLKGSYTGFYYFYPKSFKYTPLDELSVLGHVSYRFPKQDLSLKLTGGQFLYGDKGFRADFIRQFKRAEVGLFGILSQNGATIGVDLAFRLWPGKIYQNQRFRVRTESDFPFQYVYSRGFKIGETFRTYNDLSRRFRQLHVYYLNN
ncbi:YjbH domain-containing protein [Jiulongibacter sp. NS-SX5]|uniref:YjbH domain-containing protein n=1 Tax=Jiulongibacter sp. NS-SX5 TaxID=3463854 RepID=UPI00405A49A3